jgi:hypothetical protein
MRRLVVAFVIASACGGTPAPTSAQQAGPAASRTATPVNAADVVVASVNGKPVYGSCVAKQAARGATRRDALDQCVGFELLAQQAERYAADPEVTLATHTAMVSELVERDYEAKFQQPADFGAFWDQIIGKNKQHLVHGEARASADARIPVPKGAPVEDDAKAMAIAGEVAAALANERGLMAPHLQAIATRVVADRTKLDFQVVPPYLDNGGLADEYAKPLFAIPEVGRTTGPVRTPWGWDIILLTELIPAAHPSEAELVNTALPDVKRSYFPLWVTQLGQKLGLSVKIYDDNIPKLEDIE